MKKAGSPYRLPSDKMPEAEVALRLAFHLLALPGTSGAVTVCLDDHHVKSGRRTIFPLKSFLAHEGWLLAKRQGKRSWHGVYHREQCELILSSNSRGGDVVIQVGNKRIRAECKKGPLVKRKGSPENALAHNAIGQLMTIEELDAGDLLLVAVPRTNWFRSKLSWQNRPLMANARIHLVLVGRDGVVEGLDGLLPEEDGIMARRQELSEAQAVERFVGGPRRSNSPPGPRPRRRS